MFKKIVCTLLSIAAIAIIVAPEHKAEAQVAWGSFCCDGYGYRQCVLTNGPFPIGNSCFCYGKGYGYVCQ